MGAGAGAQKITTDVTGNDTAGMVAGMFASGVTAKGLNGIEAEANKLAKAPKGIDGVTEEAGNLAEDVGKAGKGLEGAAKGAESAAEDAGKVVESGSVTKISLPENDAQLKHIFREGNGHIIDTPDNRSKILNVANDKKNYLGRDARGNDWYAKTESDGSQIWVRTRNGKVDNAGVNTTPRTWDDETGLYNNTRR